MEIVAVQDGNIRLLPFFQGTDAVVDTEGFGRVDRSHGDDIGNGGAGIDEEMEDHFVHGGNAGSQGPVSQAGFTILDEKLGAEQYGIAFRSGDQELCDQIQDAVDKLVENGTYAKIAEKYPDIANNLIFLNK